MQKGKAKKDDSYDWRGKANEVIDVRETTPSDDSGPAPLLPGEWSCPYVSFAYINFKECTEVCMNSMY